MKRSPPEYLGDPAQFADRLLTWLNEGGTSVEDGQRAASLARQERAPDYEVTAALLHNVGPILLMAQEPNGATADDKCGKIVGAAWLAKYFQPVVSEPVRLQEAAKRWLLAMDKGYRDALDDESILDLAKNGGPMTEAERQQFERHQHWGASVALARRADLCQSSNCKIENLEQMRSALINSLAPPVGAPLQ